MPLWCKTVRRACYSCLRGLIQTRDLEVPCASSAEALADLLGHVLRRGLRSTASSSAASARCSARASSVRPSERRQRATHQRAIAGPGRVVLALPLRERQGEELDAPRRTRPRRATRPAHVVRRATRSSAGRRIGELRASSIPRSFHSHARSGGSTMPSMCAASTASASSPAAPATSQAARSNVPSAPVPPGVFASRPRSRWSEHARGHRPGGALPRRRRVSHRPRRTAAGAPGRARAASGTPREKHRRARPGLAGRAPRTGARCPPGRRSPRDGRARRAGRTRDHDPGGRPERETALSGLRPARPRTRMPAARPRRRGATRTRRCREDLHVERAVPAGPTERADDLGRRPSGPGTARTPGTGSGSSSATCSPVMRSTMRTRASSGSWPRLYVSTMIPASSRRPRRAREGIRERVTKPAVSRWAGWIGSKPRRTPASRAAAAARRRPSTTTRAPPPPSGRRAGR